MILIITSREDLTADFVIIELRRRGIPYFRFNTEDFPSRCKIIWGGRGVDTAEIRCIDKVPLQMRDVIGVWYRRPKPPSILADISDESMRVFVREEAKAVLDNLWMCLQAPIWVSRPEQIVKASRRIWQLEIAQRFGLSTPETIISNDASRLLDFYDRHDGDVIAKTAHQQSTTTGEQYAIYTTTIQRHEITAEAVQTPLLMQEYVPKHRELRVTLVGDTAFGVALDSQSVPDARIDWRFATMSVPHERADLPTQLSHQLVSLIQAMGLQFGAIDLVETPDGRFVFLEINPNGQWAWLQQLTGVPIREALIDLLAKGEASRNPRDSLQ